MEVVLIFAALAVTLFVSSFVCKRRFGLLGLALAAGSILSSIWGRDAETVSALLGFRSSSITSAVTLAAVILLPAVILLFHGYAYGSLFGRIIGASLFTALALAFLVEPLGHVFTLQGASADVYNWLIINKSMIIGVGLIIAVGDLFLTKPAVSSDKRHKH